MGLFNAPERVCTITTSRGWLYKVVPGTLRDQLVYTGADPEGHTQFVTFEAYAPRGGGRQLVSLRLSEITSVVEDTA